MVELTNKEVKKAVNDITLTMKDRASYGRIFPVAPLYIKKIPVKINKILPNIKDRDWLTTCVQLDELIDELICIKLGVLERIKYLKQKP